MLSAAFPFVLPEALPCECRTLLLRPNLRRLHGLSVAEVDVILTDLAQDAIILTPVISPPAPEPGDPLLWDLLAAKADLLLTGNKALFRDAGMRERVFSVQAFAAER